MSLGTLKLYRVVIAILIGTYLNAGAIMDFDLIKKGQDDNNTLLIIGGIQGDEPGGFMSASIISTHYEITKGSVWVVPNLNFHSIIERSRGPYGDMNRKFAYLSEKDPEYETIQRMKSYIKDDRVKLILNLHDGSGYYRPVYEDRLHSPHRWGQCSIIDQTKLDIPKYGNLQEISTQVVEHVNNNLLKKEDVYHVHNTRTVEGDKEMEKTLTYYAINHGKAAFGNEASKSLSTHKRVYYHLLAIEKYMDIMGIEYKRKFRLNSLGVYNALNNDIYITFYDSKIKLPLSQVRSLLKYFPIKKGSEVEFEASNPLLAIVKKGDTYVVQYGNRRLSKLKADYQDYYSSEGSVGIEVDGKLKNYAFGSIVDVDKSFLVKNNNNFRVNVIGFSNRSKKETDVKITKSKFVKRYSVDKNGRVYRVEYYNGKKFAGMVLVKFKS